MMSKQLTSCAALILLLATITSAQAQWVEPEVHELFAASPAPVGDLFGWTTVSIGDVDGDGAMDMAVSAPFTSVSFNLSSVGRIYALSGADGSTLWTRTETERSSIMGHTLEVADWNGDGTLDVLAGAPFNGTVGGRVWVFDGSTGATLHVLNHTAAGPSEGFGIGLSTGGDWNGDGIEDVLVGSRGFDNASGTNAGRVYIFSTGTGALLGTIDGFGPDHELGLGTAFLGDVSVPPDGRDEIVIGRRDQISFFDGMAHVFSFDGAVATELYAVSAGMGFQLIGDRIHAGKDVDNDGLPDFMVGDMFRNEVQVFSGLDGALLYTLDGNGEGGSFTPGHLIDDIDDDGSADVIVGSWSNDSFGNSTGKVFVYSGASGTLLRTITPTLDVRRMGIDVRTIGDFDGDGSVDFLIGSYGGGSPGPPRGRVHVISGHSVGPANLLCAPELPSDPLLADTGGDPTTGPLIGHPIEVFDVSLDCSGSTNPGPFVVVIRSQKSGAPGLTNFGHLWLTGAKLFTCSGVHAMDTVACVPGGLIIPSDPGLVGISYTVQGLCGGGNTRLSSALVQTIAD